MKRERSLIRNFMMLYSLKVSEFKLRTEAYEATEKVFIEQTGERFYKNYASFNAARNYYTKSRGRYYVNNYKVH